jgi:hypothetical protein
MNFWRLFSDRHHDSTSPSIEIDIGRVVSNVKNYIAHNPINIYVAFGTNFPCNVDKPSGCEALNSDF